MVKTFLTITEVKKLFDIQEDLLDLLEAEQIVCPQCDEDQVEKHFAPSEVEKLRLAKILMEDMGVNLEGVEVILRLRQNMLEMRRQFDAILEDIAELFRETFKQMGEKSQ